MKFKLRKSIIQWNIEKQFKNPWKWTQNMLDVIKIRGKNGKMKNVKNAWIKSNERNSDKLMNLKKAQNSVGKNACNERKNEKKNEKILIKTRKKWKNSHKIVEIRKNEYEYAKMPINTIKLWWIAVNYEKEGEMQQK